MPTHDLHPRGLFSATPTPLDAEGEPDHAALLAHARALLDRGCDGISVLGTTGEASAFSIAARKALLEALVAGGIAPHRLVPGTGLPAVAETVDLTRHALSLGVITMLMLPPYYFKEVSEDGLFAFFAEVIERVGDAQLRVVLYHYPAISGVPIPHGVIARLRDRYPACVTGIKDSSGDFANLEAMLDRFPGFAVLTGLDPLVLRLLQRGGAGCLTSMANLVPEDLALIVKGHADPAQAEAVAAAQARVAAVHARATAFAPIACLKALLAAQTGHGGWSRLRPPLVPLTAQERAQLLEAA